MPFNTVQSIRGFPWQHYATRHHSEHNFFSWQHYAKKKEKKKSFPDNTVLLDAVYSQKCSLSNTTADAVYSRKELPPVPNSATEILAAVSSKAIEMTVIHKA